MKYAKLLVLFTLFVNPAFGNQSVEAFNKKLVTDFYTEVLINGNADAIDAYIGDTYIQHNPYVADGKEAFRRFIESFPARDDSAPARAEIVRVIAEEDLVVLHVKNANWPAPNGSAIVDIFRIENNKIIEHWDVIQAVPDNAKNSNTMF